MTHLLQDALNFIVAFKGYVASGTVGVIAILAYFNKIMFYVTDILKKIRGIHPSTTQFYKTLKAKSNNTFQNSCDNIFDGIEDCVSVSIAKIKNGGKIFLPDSEAREVVTNYAGHDAAKDYVGKENEHPLDESFYEVAAESLKYGGGILRRCDLKNERYKDFFGYIKADAVRIYCICFSDEVSYLLYVTMRTDKEMSYKEKHIVQKNLSELKACFSKKNFLR